MHRFNPEFAKLMEASRQKGYATYQLVDKFLPDEGGDPNLVPELIIAFEDGGLDIIDEPDPHDQPKYEIIPESMMEPEAASSSRDPIRMYLSQMGHIPLLSREKEIFLAKQIEVARKWFRRKIAESDYAINQIVDTIEKVCRNELPF